SVSLPPAPSSQTSTKPPFGFAATRGCDAFAVASNSSNGKVVTRAPFQSYTQPKRLGRPASISSHHTTRKPASEAARAISPSPASAESVTRKGAPSGEPAASNRCPLSCKKLGRVQTTTKLPEPSDATEGFVSANVAPATRNSEPCETPALEYRRA